MWRKKTTTMNNNDNNNFVETITLTRESYDGFCKKIADLEGILTVENVNKANISNKVDDLMNEISKLKEGILSLLFDNHYVWNTLVRKVTKDIILDEKFISLKPEYDKALSLGISMDRIKEYLSNLYDDRIGENGEL